MKTESESEKGRAGRTDPQAPDMVAKHVAKIEPRPAADNLQPPMQRRSVSLVQKIAERYQVDPDKMLTTLKATAFKLKDGEVSNEQMMSLLIVADQYKLNPFTKEIYAFPDKSGGIVPVVGVDGWIRIINEHPAFNGVEFEQDEEKCTAIIYRRDRDHAIKVTEYLAECRRPTEAWTKLPKRSLRHKALIQCSRIAFGFVGFFDPDEAADIGDGQLINVTPDVSERNTAKELNTILELA